MLDKMYNTADIENELSDRWAKEVFFGSVETFPQSEDGENKPFCIMMPPANVTGSLHMGHALTYTLQDVLIRFNRMQGHDVLWQPGVDHAGIATQMVVERQLEEEGLKRSDIGREHFLDRVWAWKHQSGGIIEGQLKRLGASATWERSRFTMDDEFSQAVIKCFVDLYDQGMVYRDKRLVNWDIKFQSAISDLEVDSREEKGSLWYLKYPLADEDNQFIVVATTRPETMLGDTAIAVHPEDERYKHLIGRKVKLPLTDREISIVGDHYCDPEKGSGAVKITPGHDFNDFQVGKRHNLAVINIFDGYARLNDDVPPSYRGLERFEARKKVLQDLEVLGLLEKEEEIVHMVPYGDRSGVVIEPWLTDQWFVDTKKFAAPAIEAVETGKTVFVPEQWASTYFEWMNNIEPWCISRQIWWGHQIPAWHGPDGIIFVAETEEEAYTKARNHYGNQDVILDRDTDVLDTWFSSALWPFVTLGWPDDKHKAFLDRFYPTQVLVTGFDIIFFWVARMMMMGIHFMKKPPFSKVYIHPLVRDEKGQKMSKSKGNVINPLDSINKYGADALRFTLTALSVQGRDIKLSENRVEGYRNFITKIWNVARYLNMNECSCEIDFNPRQANLSVNQWIVHKLADLTVSVTEALQDFKFNEAAHYLYQFVWGTFCDWYIEFTKPILQEASEAHRQETRQCLAWCFVQILKLLHPITPFITDTLAPRFMKIDNSSTFSLSKTSWPIYGHEANFDEAASEIDWVRGMVCELRSLRTEVNIPIKSKLNLFVLGAERQQKQWFEDHENLLAKMAKIETVEYVDAMPGGCMQLVQGGVTLGIPLGKVIDLDQERLRLAQEMERLNQDMQKLNAKLDNKNFVARAPMDIVQEQRERRDKVQAKLEKIQQAMDRLAVL